MGITTARTRRNSHFIKFYFVRDEKRYTYPKKKIIPILQYLISLAYSLYQEIQALSIKKEPNLPIRFFLPIFNYIISLITRLYAISKSILSIAMLIRASAINLETIIGLSTILSSQSGTI